jgi:sec-independent protein translocase protein TatC
MMENSEQQPLISHLVELRDRLLRGILAILIVAICLLPFANDLYLILSAPLLEHLPETSSMIATEVASPFLTPFKLTLTVAIMLAMPVLLYQLWAFIAPGLYQHERRIVFPLMFASTLLFILGILFAYFVVFPLVFGFLTQAAPEGVAVMTDISSYLDFVLKLFLLLDWHLKYP